MKLIPQRNIEIAASDILRERKDNGQALTLATRGATATFVKADAAYKKSVSKGKCTVRLETIKRAKLCTGVSDNTLKCIMKEIRTDVKVEPGLRDALTEANRKFVEQFTVTEEDYDGKKVPIVFCQNPSQFFASILDSRGA